MNKAIYFVLNNNYIILLEKPGGVIPNINIIQNYNSYVNNLVNSIKFYLKLDKMLDIDFKPKYLYYSEKINNKYKIYGISIFEQLTNILPVARETLTETNLKNIFNKFNLSLDLKKLSTNDKINDYLIEPDNNIIKDERILFTNNQDYYNESYNIFKLEISFYLKNNDELMKKIKEYYKENNLDKIKKIFFDIVKKIYDTKDRSNEIDIFKLNNYRYICQNLDSNTCKNNLFCNYNNGKCKPTLKKSKLFNNVNRLSNEFLNNELVYKEILNIDKYYVSDIINKDNFIERPNQIILKSSNIINLDTILQNLLNSKELPKFGKKKIKEEDDDNLNEPYEKFNDYILQLIIPNSNTLFRSVSNSLYWIKNKLYNTEFRNLGYFSNIQTKISNYFKGKFIDWILDINNKDVVLNIKDLLNIKTYSNINKYIYNITSTNKTNSDFKIVLYILNKIINIPIVVYDSNINILYIYDNGNIKLDNNTSKYLKKKEYINILFEFDNINNIPAKIKSIYFI